MARLEQARQVVVATVSRALRRRTRAIEIDDAVARAAAPAMEMARHGVTRAGTRRGCSRAAGSCRGVWSAAELQEPRIVTVAQPPTEEAHRAVQDHVVLDRRNFQAGGRGGGDTTRLINFRKTLLTRPSVLFRRTLSLLFITAIGAQPRNGEVNSFEVAEEYHIADDGASGQSQLLAVAGPGEVERPVAGQGAKGIERRANA